MPLTRMDHITIIEGVIFVKACNSQCIDKGIQENDSLVPIILVLEIKNLAQINIFAIKKHNLCSVLI